MATAQMPFSVNQNGQQVETAAGWISCSLTGLRRPFRGVRGSRSFRLSSGLPRGSALLGDRRPFLQRCLAAVHTRAKGFRAGRQNLTFVPVPHEKKERISSTTVSTRTFATTINRTFQLQEKLQGRCVLSAVRDEDLSALDRQYFCVLIFECERLTVRRYSSHCGREHSVDIHAGSRDPTVSKTTTPPLAGHLVVAVWLRCRHALPLHGRGLLWVKSRHCSRSLARGKRGRGWLALLTYDGLEADVRWWWLE